ncbi:TPA: DUF4433 domain-containing protein [Bacillus cereus]|uniref:DarT ssDNA thymidine ADP-ribosyltransferase family protein n=1 Tax=Bacillus TaxID=1386 RepID=UPI0007AC287D|nr:MULTISPECIES: DarT ssDNA thymidine ADP-ribosyltransferase family protein [Bacillus]KZD79661.1 hypothetical protein B4120_2381 [Bacillus cereus]MCI2250117.1 DUF4433 domain-containing protein [Bacillus cereus]MCQ6290962.1 DUF4433 domain-containing protein [Bacillus cereus]MCT1379412.1 DUF4433 domain-containing protein [Bacillus sp. p3-SID196]BCC57934.1 hypothetical protein BCJMU10_1242 [Bacillus cereus]
MVTVISCKKLLQSPDVVNSLPYGCKWWSKYIYHFSHVTNIASILNDGLLRCRNQVKEIKNENLNDNASSNVIDGTEEKYKDYVRFYFRPLTPTQYHNEGIRAKNEITNLDAHNPVPIFLLFDTAILDEPNVFFSYESLASRHHVSLYHGFEKLAEAPFHYIYHNESTFNLDGPQIRKHRQAEVVIKDQCNLKYLQKIVCRTKAEADTLKSLLNVTAFNKYNNKICFFNQGTFDTRDVTTMFYDDYLQVLDVQQSKSNLIVKFNKVDKHSRDVDIKWFSKEGKKICEFVKKDYAHNSNRLNITMGDFLISHDLVKVILKLDGRLIYFNRFNL